MSNFMKILPVGAELFHAEGRRYGQADKMKLIVVFRNFANAPINLMRLATMTTGTPVNTKCAIRRHDDSFYTGSRRKGQVVYKKQTTDTSIPAKPIGI